MKIKRKNSNKNLSSNSNIPKKDAPLRDQKDSIQNTQPSLGSTIKETIVAGFGLGVGSEIAHRVISAVLGPRQISIESSNKEDKCQEFRNKYEQCLKDPKDNKCVNELENYQQCLKSF
jgi:hypothetical protein